MKRRSFLKYLMALPILYHLPGKIPKVPADIVWDAAGSGSINITHFIYYDGLTDEILHGGEITPAGICDLPIFERRKAHGKL